MFTGNSVTYNGFALELRVDDEVVFQARVSKLGNLKVWDSGKVETGELLEVCKTLSGVSNVENVSEPKTIQYA